MREEASLLEYSELYSIVEDIKDLNPWLYFKQLDFTTILLPNKEEPYYINVFFDEEESTINIYEGFSAINNFLKVLTSKNIPESQLIRYEKSIIISFGDKEYLLDEEFDVLKKLNKTYEDKWIYFRKIDLGYAPYLLDKYEVIETIEVLQHFYYAINDYINKIRYIDFDKGRTLFRWFNPKENNWETKDVELFLGETRYNNIILNDKDIINKIKNESRSNSVVEIDIVFLESVIEDKNFDKPIIPRLCILAEHNNGLIINQEIVTPNNNDIEVILRMIIDYLLEYGRPKKILVRDEYISSILKNLCRKINVQLKEKEFLSSIDSVCEKIISAD